MGAKHTPGPWWVVSYGDGDSLVIHHTEDDRVCFMAMPGRRGSMADIRANARLIVAAPDMLEELRLAAAQFRFYERQHRAKGTEEATNKAGTNMRIAARIEALIDKTEGRS